MDNQMNQPINQPVGQPFGENLPPKKSKFGLWLGLGIGGVIVVAMAVVAVMLLAKVDYGESYRVAKEMKTKVSDLTNNYGCTKVVDYVKSASVSVQSYQEYVEECRNVGDGVEELVAKLEQTTGVKRNKEIQEQFGRFQEAMRAVLPNKDELNQRLEIYATWHKFAVLVDDLQVSKSSDAEIQSAAEVLTGSGNQILASYGSGWLEKILAYTRAYRAFNAASYFASDYATLRTTKNDLKTELDNWVAANKPDIAKVGGLNLANASKVGSEFTKLYDLIKTEYEKNYNEESDDCWEFLDEVMCE